MNHFLLSLASLSLGGSAAVILLALAGRFTRTRYAARWWCWLWAALCLLSGGLVACQVQNAAPASGSPSSDSDTILQNKNENLPVLYDTETVSLDGLTLDETGVSDDQVIVKSSRMDTPKQDGLTVVEVTLGNGQKAVWEYPYPCFPNLLPLYLTHNERQTIVLEMDDRTSNYGAACYFILELEDGALVERGHIGLWDDPEHDLLPEEAVLYGAEINRRPDNGLYLLRIPILKDKWKQPSYSLLTWDDGAFSCTPQPDPDLGYLLMREHENYAYSDGNASCTLLFSQEGDGCVLGLALVNSGVHPAGLGNLMLGVWDPEDERWLSPIYQVKGDNGLWSSWTTSDSSLHLLCTNTVTYTGEESPSTVAHFRFDGRTLEELDRWDYQSSNLRAIPLEGRLELYSRNPQYDLQHYNPNYNGVPLPDQWVYSHTETVPK